MDVFEALSARRTIHQYKQGDIDPMLLREALTMGLYAPNHKCTFPWKFLIVGPETRQAIMQIDRQITRQKKQTWSEADEAALDAKQQKKMANPAALVVFCCAQSDDDFRQREDYATVACSIQNFCLALTAHGYGTKWSTGKVTRHLETYQALGVDPNAYEIIGFVWVGLADSSVPPRKRPALDDVLEVLP